MRKLEEFIGIFITTLKAQIFLCCPCTKIQTTINLFFAFQINSLRKLYFNMAIYANTFFLQKIFDAG